MKTAAANDFIKTNWSWFRRHLNLTLGLVWLTGLIVIVLLVNLLPEQDNMSLLIGIVGTAWGISVYVIAGWVLHYKRRSLAWLLLFGIGVLLALVLENKYEANRFTFHDNKPDEVPPEAINAYQNSVNKNEQNEKIERP